MATLCGAIAGVALGLSLKSMGDGIYTPRQARYILLRSHKIMKIHVFISATWATLASCSWTCWSVSSFRWLFQALSPPLGLLISKCLERWLKSIVIKRMNIHNYFLFKDERYKFTWDSEMYHLSNCHISWRVMKSESNISLTHLCRQEPCPITRVTFFWRVDEIYL